MKKKINEEKFNDDLDIIDKMAIQFLNSISGFYNPFKRNNERQNSMTGLLKPENYTTTTGDVGESVL